MSHTRIVQGIYEAFGRGDIATILAKLDDDVEWEYGMAPNDVPWLQPRKGRAEVGKFFESLTAIEIHHFMPKAILACESLVVGLVDITFTAKATGKKVTEKEKDEVIRVITSFEKDIVEKQETTHK